MIEIAFERLPTQICTHLARIVQQRQRLAMIAATVVGDGERMSDKAETIRFERTA